MHWGNWLIWQHTFQHHQPIGRFLADDQAPQSQTVHILHGAQNGPISVGHQPNVPTQVPSQLPTPHGDYCKWHCQCDSVH
jgi:hypothetical protein